MRTAEDRQREMLKRQLARQAHLRERPNRRQWWAYGLAAVCFLSAGVIGMVAAFGQLTFIAVLVLVIVGGAALTN